MSFLFSSEEGKVIQNNFSRAFPRVHYAYNFYCDAYEDEPTLYIVDSRTKNEYIVTTSFPHNVFNKNQIKLNLMKMAIAQKANNSLKLLENA